MAVAGRIPIDADGRFSGYASLFNTLDDAKGENDLPRRDALLDELRALAVVGPLIERCSDLDSSIPRRSLM